MVNKKRLTNTFLNFAIIDSPSFSEREVCEKIISILEPLGFKITVDDSGDKLGGNCGNIYAVLEGDDKSLDPLLFCAHMDTVQPCYFKHPIIDSDGTIHSDGSTIIGADDLSAVSEIIEAVTLIYEHRMKHRTIELLFTVAEEAHCEGSKLFDFSKIKSKECYVLDYDGQIGFAANAAPAKVGFTARIIGKSAHAGFEPERGINAIATMAKAISQVKQGRVSESATLNIGTIKGGSATNIISDSCEISGEIRALSTDNAVKIAKDLETQINKTCEEYKTQLVFEHNVLYKSFKVSPKHSVVQRYQKAVKSIGIKPELRTTFGGSDNNVMFDNGITGIVIASGMHNCHSTEEYTTVDEMEKVTEILLSLMTSD